MVNKKYHILKEYANGVIDQKGNFSPFKVTTNALAAKPGIRYYIKEATIKGANCAVHAGATSATITCTFNRQTLYIAQLGLPISAAADGMVVLDISRPGILTDLNTAITMTSNFDAYTHSVIYAEVEESEGEYLQ